MSDEHYYKVGGSLEYQHPTYVVRQADCDLYEGLKNGEFCYVLNSRQMGKSSLRVQMMKKLKEQGIKCASIDMTRIGSHVTPSEWYAGVISELLRGFGLSKTVNFSSWWRDRDLLPPLQRLRELIEDVLLAEFPEKLVIFIDEIDSIIKIKFKEDFFAFIRACYNQRVDNPDYKRLTFCLLGVATPSDLIEDRNVSTPFNIGRAIELTGFQLHEAAPLAQGLLQKAPYPQAVLREVLVWTGGQPFLTQKVCKLILSTSDEIPPGDEARWVEQLVRSQIIENWETQDEPEHLRTIRDRILWSQRKGQLLLLYQQILQTSLTPPYQGVKANDKPEHMELRLSGLVVKQQGKLRIYNRIYGCIFDRSWVENALVEAGLEPEVVAETLAPSTSEIQSILDSAPNAEVRKLAAETLVAVLGEMLARQGDIEKAIAAYAEAQKLDPTIEIPATIGNNLCWWGSLWGHSAEVMDACETAVALDPENAMFRDSRGLARALTGDISGAIEDFQAFVNWTDNERKRVQRQHWIEALRAGMNPFTEEEIESLLNEYNIITSERLKEKEIEVYQDQLNFVGEDRNIFEVDEVAKLQKLEQTPSSTSRRILWVDDNPANIADEIAQLRERGTEVTEAISTSQAMQILVSSGLSFNAIVSDMGRTEEGEYQPKAGISLIKAVREAGINLPILIYTTLTLYTRTINEIIAAGGNGATMSAEELFAWIRDRTGEGELTLPHIVSKSVLEPTSIAQKRLITTITNKLGEGFIGELLVHDKLVRLYQGDITNLVADVIVSSDDTYLQMDGGVSRRIREVGGEEIYWEARKLIPFSLGNIAVTTAGKLPAKKIFHGVVIDWYKGIFPSTNIIQQVVHNCLEKAHQYGFSSIAFPLLGTGAAGFPVQEALEITLKQIISDLSQENQNILVAIVAIYNINDGREILKQLNLKNFLERI